MNGVAVAATGDISSGAGICNVADKRSQPTQDPGYTASDRCVSDPLAHAVGFAATAIEGESLIATDAETVWIVWDATDARARLATLLPAEIDLDRDGFAAGTEIVAA